MIKKNANTTILIISLISISFSIITIRNLNSVKDKKINDTINYDNIVRKTKDIETNVVISQIESFYSMYYKELHSSSIGIEKDKTIYLTFANNNMQIMITPNNKINFNSTEWIFNNTGNVESFNILNSSDNKYKYYQKLLLSYVNIQSLIKSFKPQKFKNVAPIIKFYPVKGYELSIGGIVPKYEISILIPKEIDLNDNMLFYEKKINSNKILFEKSKQIIDILDNFSLFLEGKQYVNDDKNLISQNYLTNYGSVIVGKTGGDIYVDKIVKNIDFGNINSSNNIKYFLNTNGFSIIEKELLEMNGDNPKPNQYFDISNDDFYKRLTKYNLETSSSDYKDDDVFLFDFRHGLFNDNSNNNVNNIYEIDWIDNHGDVHTNKNYVSEKPKLDEFLTTYKLNNIQNARILCSFNDNCGLKYTIDETSKKITNIENIKTFEFFKEEFPYSNKIITTKEFEDCIANDNEIDDCESQKLSTQLRFLKKENPFYITNDNKNLMNIYIDVSSGTSYGDLSFNNHLNATIYTIGTDKYLDVNCDECHSGFFNRYITKKYYIIKG